MYASLDEGGIIINTILYSNGCDQCNDLKSKLKQSNIEYTENNNIDEMLGRGFISAPMLEVDGDTYDYNHAIKWLDSRK